MFLGILFSRETKIDSDNILKQVFTILEKAILNMIMQCHRNFIEVEIFNYLVKFDIFGNLSKNIGCTYDA